MDDDYIHGLSLSRSTGHPIVPRSWEPSPSSSNSAVPSQPRTAGLTWKQWIRCSSRGCGVGPGRETRWSTTRATRPQNTTALVRILSVANGIGSTPGVLLCGDSTGLHDQTSDTHGTAAAADPRAWHHQWMRELSELMDTDDPAWPALQDLFAAGSVPLTVLPADPEEGRRGLLQMQVTTRSALGSMVLNCGGLVVDDGWVRVFGAGSGAAGAAAGAMPSLAQVNAFPAAFEPGWRADGGLIVGHDAVGGVFALNGLDPAAAGRPGSPGQMTYFAPDTLAWEEMRIGHSAWLSWLVSGRLEKFYEGTRWPTWREDARALTFEQGIAVFPPLWSEQARADLAATSRRAVPMREVLGVAADFAAQTGSADPGFLGAV